MIHRFVNHMQTQGWRAETGSNLPLPRWITSRYPSLPDLWLQFIGEVRELFSPDETTWFLCAEELSQINAEGDEDWTSGIRAFWDSHLPIVLSVRDGYAYYAISMADGSVVYGSEPEFEECRQVAVSFEAFLKDIMDGNGIA